MIPTQAMARIRAEERSVRVELRALPGTAPSRYRIEDVSAAAAAAATFADAVNAALSTPAEEFDDGAYKAFPAPALTMRSARMEDRLRMRVLRCSVGSSIWCAMPMKAP